MTKLTDRMSKLMANPKTQQMINKAKAAANKPENREKLSKMSNKISSKMRKSDNHGAHGGPPPPAAPTSPPVHPDVSQPPRP
jgi:hypothetical protein